MHLSNPVSDVALITVIISIVFQGLRQGCLAYPILFSLFINELAHEIISAGVDVISLSSTDLHLFILLFADDLLFLVHQFQVFHLSFRPYCKPG